LPFTFTGWSISLVTSRADSPKIRRRPKDRKQQLLAHARDLFVELGYQNVTMSAIAARAGITASALYRHFATKAVLLEAVVDESFADIYPGANDAADDSSLAVLIDAAAERAVARPYLGTLWSREVRNLPRQRQAVARAALRNSAQHFARLIRSERPELSAPEAELLSWAVQSVLATPSHHSIRTTASQHAGLLRSACLAVVDAQLSQEPAASQRSVRSELAPFSRREQLLVAAMNLFARRGYHETSLDDIGAAVGVTGPNLYQHFDSKSALLLAVIERATHGLWLDLDAALSSQASAPDALVAVVAGYVARLDTWPMLGWHDLNREQSVAPIAKAYRREYAAEWVALLRQGREDLDQTTARVIVSITLTVIHDLAATPRLAAAENFRANVTAISLALLAGRRAPLSL
jgi:AcrR family transcriptional regulator